MEFSKVEKQKPQPLSHRLELDNLRSISMTGVIDVPMFTDKSVTVKLAEQTLYIQGQGLAVKSLDVENGRLSMSGQVFSLKYTTSATPSSLMKRIFK